MDITFSNVLEGARQYFQGLPSPANTGSSSQAPQNDCSINGRLSSSSPHYNHLDVSGITGASVYENVNANAGTHILNQQPKQHAVISSVQTHQKNIGSTASSSCSSVLNYWPAYQRTKDNTVPTSSESYHNLASRSYISSKVLTQQSQNAAPLLYNGSRMPLPEASSVNYRLQNNVHQSHQPRPQGHNLPPIAALSNYHSNRVTSNSSTREKTLSCASQTTHHIHPTLSSASQSIQLLDKTVRPQTEYTSHSQHDNIQYATSASVTTVTNSTASHYVANKYQQIESVATYTKITPQQIPLLASASATSSTSSSSSSKYELSSQHGTIQHHQQQSQHHLQQPQCHLQQEKQQQHQQHHQQQQHQQQHHQQQQQQHQQQHHQQQQQQHQQQHHQQQQQQQHHQQQQQHHQQQQHQQQHHQQQHLQQQQHQQQHLQQQQHQQQHHQHQQQQHLNQQYVNLHTNGRPHPQLADSQTKSEKHLSSHSSKLTQQYSHQVHFTTANRLQAAPSATIVHASSQQRCTLSTASSSVPSPSVRNCGGRNKRESPLDLSVKTVRQSADSTAKDDNDCVYSIPGYSSGSLDHQSRPKQHSLPGMTTVRSRTPQQQTVILPPLQLPSSIAYPTFDPRTSKTSANGSSAAVNISNESNMGAPKVDFLPNFGTSHNAVTTYSSKSQQNCSTKNSLHHPTYRQQVSAAPLPNVGSFKSIANVSSVNATYEPKLATHFPSALSQTQQRHLTTNSSSSSVASLLPGSSSNIVSGYENAKLVSNTVANYRSTRVDYSNRIAGSRNNSTYSVLGQKRSSEIRHPSPAKLPKLDTWRQTIDQQIEQRLSSYSSSRAQQQQLNGNMSNCNFSHDAQCTSHLSQQRFQNQQQQYNLSAVSRTQAVATTSAQHSLQTATQSVHYYSNHGHTHYANPTTQHPSERGNSVHKLHNSNASLISQQANERSCVPTDKQVLSILRNSLEIKEARMTELQNQLAQNQLLEQNTCIHQNEHSTAASQNHSKQAKQCVQQLNEMPNLQHSAVSKSSVETLTPQKLISVSEAIVLPNPLDKPHQISIAETQKIQMPKGIDSPQLVVTSTKMYSVAKPSDDNQHVRAELTENKCGSNNLSSAAAPGSGDAEVIASYLLAARAFRTKAELKQVGPSLEHQQQTYRCGTPTSSSSLKSPGTPVVFSPPPSGTGQVVADTGSEEFLICLQEKEHTPPTNDSILKNHSTPSGASSSGSSPPKLTRERAMFPPRRKLFSRSDEEPGGSSSSLITAFPPSRDPSGLRSSSETSVFDFPDTDSEGEMPVLEMQTLDEMRRDRRSHIKTSHQTTPVTEILEVFDDDIPESAPKSTEPSTEESTPLDPFWSTACEKFLEQLKGGSVKRTCRRKKTAAELKSMYEKYEVSRIEAKQIEESELLDPKDESMSGDKTSCEDSQHNSEAVVKQLVTKAEESDEDVPLIKRKERSKTEKEEKDTEDEISLAEIKARLGRKHDIDQLTPMKNWKHSRSSDRKIISNSSDSAEDDISDICQQTVAERLRKRKRKGLGSDSNVSIRMKLRSKELLHKMRKGGDKSKEVPYRSGCKKKKLQFGDGSDFRPGWEEELYRFKRSLRMPVRLINIPRPPSAYRVSTSLPDLDPYPSSPAASTMDSSDFTSQNQQHSQCSNFLDQHQNTWGSLRSEAVDSDIDSSSNASISWLNDLDSEDATSSTIISSRFTTNNDSNSSILNVLVNKYSRNRVSRKTSQDKGIISDSSNPQAVLRSSSSRQEGGSEVQNKALNGSIGDRKCKRYSKKKFVKVVKDDVESTNCSEESVHLDKSLKRTISNFHDAFQQSSEILPEKFAPTVYKSRTRKQTRTLQQRATLCEIFGEDRPASAPPTCQESNKCENKTETNTQGSKSFRAISRQGLRSAGLRRSSKAVLNSKRHLLRRNNDLLRVLTGKDCLNQELLPKISGNESSKHISQDALPVTCDLKVRRRRLKLRSVRRKFRSGFDYIRKKKKQQRKEGDAEGHKERKKCFYPRPTAESAQDIQNEIKGWVINKGLGETLLHRAARLGYTDVAAYCLEKLDHAPSPRDNAGYTPLHEACSRGHLEIARLLLMYGADVSESALGGIRPLHEAAENGFTELIRLLLSYGADPLLATYSGYTPLSLASNDEARRLLQQHLGDVQGLAASPWTFLGPAACCDPPISGYDPLSDPPCASPEPLEESELEIETSEACLPALYRLRCEPPEERWVLLQDLTQLLRIKSRDALLRQLCAEAKNVLREFKMADFLEQARCCHLLSSGEKVNVRASKVALVRYNEKVRELLGIEKVTISLR